MKYFSTSCVLLGNAVFSADAAAHTIETAQREFAPAVEPWLVFLMLVSLCLYVRGVWKIWRRAGSSRPLVRRRAILFAAGWLILAATVLSPLHAASARSFTLHMAEHEIIMLLVAPLLALARPLGIMVWALPMSARRGLARSNTLLFLRPPWRALTRPLTATLLQIAALWIWHAPALFDRALRAETWHTAQHLSFLFSAILFWWALLRSRASAREATAAVYLFITALAEGFLGALMALSVSPWYSRYAAMGMAPFGLTPVEDQQLAGLLMWMPGGLIHAGAAIVLLAQWLQHAHTVEEGGDAALSR